MKGELQWICDNKKSMYISSTI